MRRPPDICPTLFRVWSLCALSMVRASAESHCTNNEFFQSFDIQNPLEKTIVRRVFYLRLAGRVFDIPFVQANNELFSACLYLDSELVGCGYNFFDEIDVTVGKDGFQELLVELHHRERGVLCHAKTIIFCCDDDDIDRRKHQSAIEAKLPYALQYIRNESRPTVSQPRKLPCPWCCPAEIFENKHSRKEENRDIKLIFGIKSAAINVASRVAIRSSWLGRLPSYACAYFLIGDIRNSPQEEDQAIDLDLSKYTHCLQFSFSNQDESFDLECSRYISSSEKMLMKMKRRFLDIEAAKYSAADEFNGDLLEPPHLTGLDSYNQLIYKSAGFLKWVQSRMPFTLDRLEHVVIMDDDVYVRVSPLLNLLSPQSTAGNRSFDAATTDETGIVNQRGATCPWKVKESDEYYKIATYPNLQSSENIASNVATSDRFYAGEVFAARLHHSIKPQRNPAHTHYLSKREYPLSELPLFVAGNFIILSKDLVDFVGANFDKYLRPLKTLEDLSFAQWFQAMQVFPAHIPGVISITDAKELPYTGDDTLLLSRASQHICCNCHAHEDDIISIAEYTPLMAVYNMKTNSQFEYLNDVDRKAESHFDLFGRKLVDHQFCDVGCFKNAYIDNAIIIGIRNRFGELTIG